MGINVGLWLLHTVDHDSPCGGVWHCMGAGFLTSLKLFCEISISAFAHMSNIYKTSSTDFNCLLR